MKNALEMFALKGFDAVSVDDIARKANCNKAMIYYHFSSKKALYQLILKDVLKDMLKQMNPIFKSAGEILQGNPILLYRMLIGSIIFYFISRPLPKTILNIDSTETEETYSENKRIILDILMRGIHNDSK